MRFQEEVFNGHDFSVETLAKHLTADFIDHTAGPHAVPGVEGVAQRLLAWHSAFGDARKDSVAILAENDMVAVLYDIHAVHTGPLKGIEATHNNVVIPGIEIFRYQDGKASDYWSIYDYLSTAAEIGARLSLLPFVEGDGLADFLEQDVYRGIVHQERRKHNVFAKDSTDEEVIRNKQTLRRFQEEVFNGHDWRVETLAKHLTPDFVDHAAGPGDTPGLEGVSERFTIWQSAFDDAMEENMAMVGQEDMLAVLYDLHAVHRGDFIGVSATNRNVVIPGIEMLRFRDGKIAEHWGIYDFEATAAEIGARMVFTPLPEGDWKDKRSVRVELAN